MEISKDFITDILTLRYHPTKPSIPPLTIDDFSNQPVITPEHNLNMVDDMIKKSIKRTIKEHDTISLALSGGVDSTFVLSQIRECYPKLNIHCISVGFDETDIDLIAAEKIASYFNCKFHGVLIKNPLEDLPKQISIAQEPRWNIFWYYVVREAKKYSDIIVTGDGGDEVFAGYVFRYKKFLELTNENDGWMDRVIKYMQCHNRDWVDDQQNMFAPTMSFNWQSIYNKLKYSFDNDLSPINQVLLADFNGKLLYDWIPVNEKIYNHFNILGYSPLMNIDLAKWNACVPIEQKYNNTTNKGKLPLRALLKKSGCEHLLISEKKGYAPNLITLWEKYGKNICIKFLSHGDSIKYKMINDEWITSAFYYANKGDIRYIAKLLSVLSLEIWCKIYITHSLNPDNRL